MPSGVGDSTWRNQALFGLNTAMLLAAFALPWPWLPDVYVTAFDAVANVALVPINAASTIRLHFMPPVAIAPQGSWKGELRVIDINAGRAIRTQLDVQGFSYRPFTTYLALAIACPSSQMRRSPTVPLLAGAILVLCLGFLLAALPILSRLSRGGFFSLGMRLAIATAYEAMATPLMVYAIPLILFLAVTRVRVR